MLIWIDSDAELERARTLVERLWESDDPADIARLQTQARLIAAYEESKWPRRPASTAALIRHLTFKLFRTASVPLAHESERAGRFCAAREAYALTRSGRA